MEGHHKPVTNFLRFLPDSILPPEKGTNLLLANTIKLLVMPKLLKKAVKKVCHCEPSRRMVWQSVPLLTEITILFLVKSARLKEEH